MPAVEFFFFEKWNFFWVTTVDKSSKNQNFHIILGHTLAIRVPNMYIKSVRIGPVVSEKRSTQHEKNGFEKNAFKVFFHEKSLKNCTYS